jgi:ParB family chromosome partitioning protein
VTHQEPKIQNILVADIVVEHDKRHRLTTESGVDSIIASIEELGGISNPISLRKKRRAGVDTLVLIDGMHRLEAAKKLELLEVPARVWVDITDDYAEMMELDMNLAGAELSPLDEAVFLANRKRLYEEMHPETVRGVAGAAAKWDATANSAVASFVEATAEATGVSVRKIYSRVAVGQMLTKEEVIKLRAAPQTLKAGDVEALAKIKEDHIRMDVIDKIQHGTAKSVSEAIKAVSPSKPVSPTRKADADYRKFISTWKRLPLGLRHRFVDECSAELRDIRDQLVLEMTEGEDASH